MPPPKTDLSGNFFLKCEAPLEGMDRKISFLGDPDFLFFHSMVEALSSTEAPEIIVEGCNMLFHRTELELAASSGV